jgi:hypothetical protein
MSPDFDDDVCALGREDQHHKAEVSLYKWQDHQLTTIVLYKIEGSQVLHTYPILTGTFTTKARENVVSTKLRLPGTLALSLPADRGHVAPIMRLYASMQ